MPINQQQQSSTIGYQPSAIRYQLSAIGYQPPALHSRLSAIGYPLSANFSQPAQTWRVFIVQAWRVRRIIANRSRSAFFPLTAAVFVV